MRTLVNDCRTCARRFECEKATHFENYRGDSGCSDYIEEEKAYETYNQRTGRTDSEN